VPYTSEELALFHQPAPAPKPEAVAIRAVKAAPTDLMASADGYFSAHEYKPAADDYQQILHHDENNGLALANLAAIELSEGHLADAEKHILAAVALSPNDAYNQSVLGHLRLEQQDYDAALDSLGRAAKLDPNNANIQVWLGITLGHQGLRQAAETALRQALVLDPNNADAHNNLAVIYISETPPRAELARWHYLKALGTGQPHNAGLEKLLAENGAAITIP
jgi:Flp pilus assembly protein TadD